MQTHHEEAVIEGGGGSATQPGSEGYPTREPGRLNPYLSARKESGDRYSALASRALRAERTALLCGGLTFLLALGLVAMALRQPKVVVVAVNSKGDYLGMATSNQPFDVTTDMKRSALFDWVTSLRAVTPDGIAQRTAIDKVYAMISNGSAAQEFVSDFYRADPPHARAVSQTVHIDVNSILPTSDRTCEVEWLEVTRDLRGNVINEQRWKGAFSYVISPNANSDERSVRLNPIGMYVTEASWSKVL